jgi:2-polyprenyl-6-methoxyphenol hydroxylase-like FAD-dependent oxidoreductase
MRRISCRLCRASVNLALADAVDLADAIGDGLEWSAIAAYESSMAERARGAADASAKGLHSI